MNWLQDFFSSFGQDFVDKIKIGGQNVTEGIGELLDFSAVFTINLGFVQIPITKAAVNLLLTLIILPVVFWILSRKRDMKPGRLQSTVESLLELLNRLCVNAGLSEEQARVFAPFAGALFCYILVSNLLTVFSLEAAAVNPAFPIAMALFDVICVIAWGIKFVGVTGFLRSLVAPRAFMLPFNLLDYVIKPVSLSFRLFGNIFGASILIAFLRAIVPLFLPQVLGLWFDFGDGIVQALIFGYLTITYVGEIVEKSGHNEPQKKKETAKAAETTENEEKKPAAAEA